MTNNDIKIPFGLCEITYDNIKLPNVGDAGEFKAIPTYTKMFGGALNSTQHYILESYEVTFTVYIESESYEALKLHMPTLQNHEHGLYDSAQNVDMTGARLIIHPKGAENKNHDICLWNAYISPETEFTRTYKKEKDMFEVKFIGKPSQVHIDFGVDNSYFFIGDWSELVNVNDNRIS